MKERTVKSGTGAGTARGKNVSVVECRTSSVRLPHSMRALVLYIQLNLVVC